MGDFNAADIAARLRDMELDATNVQYTPPEKPDDSATIGRRLSLGQIQQAVQSKLTPQNNSGKIIDSMEVHCKYKDKDGVLVKNMDGSVDFIALTKNSKGEEIGKIVYKFKSEKDFKKEKPIAEEIYKRFDGKFNKVQETTFEYYRNGKVKYSLTKNKDGNVIKESNFNRKGKVEKNIIYDKEGKLQSTYTYTYEKDGTRLSRQTDKDGNLVATGKTTYNGDKPATTEQWYPDGTKKFDITYDENGKIRTKKEFYPDGKINAETEFYDNGVIKTQNVYDENGTIKSKITDEIDGKFDVAAQKGCGDCYLMASINALRQTEEGQKMLSDLITITTDENGKKIYTVNFSGAKIAAESLKKDNRIQDGTVAITGTYTFTEEEMQEKLKQAGIEYSIGDGDAILVEAAFEKYREEVRKTLDANNLKNQQFIAGLITGPNENDALYGGQTYDALFVLTGQKSEVYKGNPAYCLDAEDLHEGKISVISNAQVVATLQKAVSEVTHLTKEETELNEMLDKIMKDSSDGTIDYMGTAGFMTMDDKGKGSGHALTIKSVTADTVTLINPWFPDKEVTMSREDFVKSVKVFALTPLHAKQSQQQAVESNGTTDPSNPSNGSITAPPINGNNNNSSGTSSNPTPSSSTPSNNNKPEQYGTYKIPSGIRYTNMIIEMLKEQNIPQTKENIKKAKEQFEALNPGAVKTNRRFKNKRGQLIPYVLAGATVKTPKFEGFS